jgi:hypothetical protein
MIPIVIEAPVPMTLLPTRVWTQGQWEGIKRGYRAQDMDEKWDVFVEGQVVFLHRSWTGRGVFEASFVAADGGWQISAGVTESDPSVREFSAEGNRVLLELVLTEIVLGEPAPDLRAELVRLSPTRDDGRAFEPGAILHSLLGLRSNQ